MSRDSGLLERPTQALKQRVRTLRARPELTRLAHLEHPAARPLADALTAALAGRLTPEERRVVDGVEALRARLEHVDDLLTLVDFGSGSAGTDRSDTSGRTIERSVSEICRTTSKPPRWALLLFQIVRHLRPERCLELGTSLGISAAYQAAALELNGSGRITTLEGAEPVAALAAANLDELGLDRTDVVVGRFQDTLDGVLELGPIDYAFVDGHHDRDATIRYFEHIAERAGADAVLAFDDIAWSEGMQEAWRTIREDGRVAFAIDLRSVGVCALGRSPGTPTQLAVAFA
jgi:predicted O-methyltransferase YrrM